MADAPSPEVLVDPAISRAKFEREVAAFRALADDHRAHGWWLLDATYPEVLVAFVAPQLRPAAVLYGVVIEFTNYDLWAPSVRFVDPFTKRRLLAREISPALAMHRRVIHEVPGAPPGFVNEEHVPLLMHHGPETLPFLCIPGVREYHDHPAHTGDSWLLHRGNGEGTLYFILETIAKYGLTPIRGYQFGLQISGFVRGDPPL